MDILFLQPYSLDVLDTALANTDACVLPQAIWAQWIENQETEVLLVEVSQRTQRFVLHVASHQNENRDGIFLPSRMCAALDIHEYVEVRMLQEMPPPATKIVLQPLDEDLASAVDVSTIVSETLSKWHTLQEGTILTIECQEIGGLPLDILVKSTEPAPLVLLRGEVPFEMEPLERPESPQMAFPLETPSPIRSSWNAEEDFALPIPIPQTGFVPFSGSGYRLGGS